MSIQIQIEELYFGLSPKLRLILPHSQLTLEPGDCGIECSFLASLHLRVGEISSHSKSVGASFKIFPLISRSILPISQNLVGDGLRLEREPLVISAAVDEDGGLGQCEIFLGMTSVSLRTGKGSINQGKANLQVLGRLDERGVVDNHHFELVLEGEVKDGSRCWHWCSERRSVGVEGVLSPP